MKVFKDNGSDICSHKKGIQGGKVLKKLILKAEKRKLFAENFHIYAVLQSTITRLKLDNYYLSMRNVSHKAKYGNCVVEMMEQNRKQSSCVKNSGKLELSVTNSVQFDEDPLSLNSFFEELKNR